MNTTSAAVVRFSVEVITLPVSDVERALRFYVDQAGFTLDVDYAPSESFREGQLHPPGSGCSIQIGKGLTTCLPLRWPTSLRASRGRFSTRGASSRASRPMRWLPVQRNPRAVLGAVKAWPGSTDARGETCATASLDGPCARRVRGPAGRDEGTATRHEQRNSASKMRRI